MLFESGKTYVRNLRARSRERDATALRLGLDRALSSMDLHPPGVPVSAIVCVRALRARRPDASARGRAGASRSWEEAVTSSLARLAARAARPARGPVPEDADAVLFADRAELLACLATDWLKGAATAERWWWRGLLSARTATRALVLGEWLEAPEHAPPALEHLARVGLAVAFARALDEMDASRLLARVARAYGVEGLLDALEATAPGDEGAGESFAGRGLVEVGGRGRGEGGDVDDASDAPWLRYAAEGGAAGLGRERRSLLGVCLSLARAPHVARSISFARELREWRAAKSAAPEASAEQGAAPRVGPRAPAREAAKDSGRRALHDSSADAAAKADAARPSNQSSPDVSGTERGRVERASVPARLASDGGGPAHEGAERSVEECEPRAFAGEHENEAGATPRAGLPENDVDEGRRERAEVEASPEVESERDEARARLLEASVETRLGGLFYLVNVGLFLELYGDFTTPHVPGLALPVWDFVALLGRELYGAGVCEDPVWPLLAGLAGRGVDEEPGLHFPPPDEWRVPESWLKPFGKGGLRRPRVEGGRLRRMHRAGFVALDAPARPFEGGAAVSLRTWVGWVAGYVKARLRLALGLSGGRGLARLLCEQEARVVVTASHVDVHFRLAGLPIEVRLAGLDRNPGWIPAAGRYVAFHYE